MEQNAVQNGDGVSRKIRQSCESKSECRSKPLVLLTPPPPLEWPCRLKNGKVISPLFPLPHREYSLVSPIPQIRGQRGIFTSRANHKALLPRRLGSGRGDSCQGFRGRIWTKSCKLAAVRLVTGATPARKAEQQAGDGEALNGVAKQPNQCPPPPRPRLTWEKR